MRTRTVVPIALAVAAGIAWLLLGGAGDRSAPGVSDPLPAGPGRGRNTPATTPSPSPPSVPNERTVPGLLSPERVETTDDPAVPEPDLLEGRVVDGEGRPVAGVGVDLFVLVPRGGDLEERFLDRAQTGEGGGFLASRSGTRVHAVRVDPETIPGRWADPPEITGATLDAGGRVEFTVRPHALVRGHVRDARTGLAVTRFSVRGRGDRTVEDGAFEEPVGPDAPLVVEARGYGPWGFEGGLSRGETRSGVVAALEPLAGRGTLEIRAADASGRVPGSLLVSGLENGRPWTERVPSSGGVFRVERLPAGRVFVAVQAPGYDPLAVRGEVPEGGAGAAEARLFRGGVVRIRVLEGTGKPVPRPDEVVLEAADGSGVFRTRHAEVHGTFPTAAAVYLGEANRTFPPEVERMMVPTDDGGDRIGFVPPGDYRLMVRHGGAERTAAFSLAEGEDRNLEVRMGE